MKILEDVDGHVLHRDRDIPFYGIKVGDGWVEKPDNLRDDAWDLYGDAVACDNALIEGMVFDVQRNAVIQKNAKVYGNANIGGDAMICDHAVARVMGYAGVSGNARTPEFLTLFMSCLYRR